RCRGRPPDGVPPEAGPRRGPGYRRPSGHAPDGYVNCENRRDGWQADARGVTMNFILWLIVGGIIGWIASMIMRTNAQQGIFLNIIVGIIGALLAGWLITPLVGGSTINEGNFSLSGLVISLLGAIVLLAIVNLFRRGRAR